MNLEEIGSVVSLAVAAAALYFSRKKTDAEAENIRAESMGKRIENAEELIEYYKKDAETIRNENKELIKKLAESEARHIIELNEAHRTYAEHMKDMNHKLNERIEDLESENAMLKKQLSSK